MNDVWRIPFGAAATLAAGLSWAAWHALMDSRAIGGHLTLGSAVPIIFALALYLLVEMWVHWKAMKPFERTLGVGVLVVQIYVLGLAVADHGVELLWPFH